MLTNWNGASLESSYAVRRRCHTRERYLGVDAWTAMVALYRIREYGE
jgi:hypothetical protein